MRSPAQPGQYLDNAIDVQARVLENADIAYRDAVRITQNRFAGKIASIIDVSRAQNQLGASVRRI